MFLPDNTNQRFALAAQFVQFTNVHLFITGKAGTGKTTFLKYIREHSNKKMVIVAPTGVAAMNAGGVTIHSFFYLPPGMFVPTTDQRFTQANTAVLNQQTIFKHARFNSEKRKLIQELELLVIDEASMLRADMLDAMDTVLRHYRDMPQTPFGGVQVLYIGDLFQLSPVAGNEEWEVLKQFYQSPFFFDAHAARQLSPLVVELDKIYRQRDHAFITILNNIRHNQSTAADLEQLHTRYLPGFEPATDDPYITLTTHNARADAMNQDALDRLPGEVHEFAAEIKGDFSERNQPADKTLFLKEGAQVIFIRNDKGDARRFYNGKIGHITAIKEGEVYIRFPGEPDDMLLEREVWRNIRYVFHPEKDHIEEEEMGSFAQYPIRLAWAITIHKSQGLTFERAIVDAGASFAPGQVYVALSRLTSMEGLVLHSRILPESIRTDERILQYANQTQVSEAQMQQYLSGAQQQYLHYTLQQQFSFSKLVSEWQDFFDGYAHRKFPEKTTAIFWAKETLEKIVQLQGTAAKFNKQIAWLTSSQPDYTQLQQRIEAAAAYFLPALKELQTSLKKHIDDIILKKFTQQYYKELSVMRASLTHKQQQVQQAAQMVAGLLKGEQAGDLLQQAATVTTPPVADINEIPAGKGATKAISLQLFKAGKKVDEIAALREMAVGTIEGHLAAFVTTGEIALHELVTPERAAIILSVIEKSDKKQSSVIKAQLGDDYTWGEVRAALAHWEKERK